jgi:uncharacterized membrane protein
MLLEGLGTGGRVVFKVRNTGLPTSHIPLEGEDLPAEQRKTELSKNTETSIPVRILTYLFK